MQVSFFFSEKVKQREDDAKFKQFIQRVINRWIVGGVRYGSANSKQKYLTRLKLELKAYNKTGNAEHLLNIAVYSYLESVAPEHKKSHFDNTIDSITRNIIK